MNDSLQILPSDLNDIDQILRVYQSVAKDPGGIIRIEDEVTKEYVLDFLVKSIEKGLTLVARIGDRVVGEIHAYTPDIFAFQHLLTDLTIVVDPDYQCKGIGRKLFEAFIEIVTLEMVHILRIELYTREYNDRNVRFYESLGFINEGRQHDKIFVSPGVYETPLHMAWLRQSQN